MYLDRLDGRISADFFDQKSKEWREQQKRVEARIAQWTTTGLRSATEAIQMMKDVSDTCAGFEAAEPQRQRANVARTARKRHMAGRRVRGFLEIAVRQNGTLELRKSNATA